MSAPSPSKLDLEQCIQGSFDDQSGKLRVDAQLTAPLDINGELAVDIRATDGDSVLIVGTEDATPTGTQNVVKVNSDGSLNVNTVITPGISKSIYSVFNQISSVANGALTTVLSHTVPVGKVDYIGQIEVSGDNIAQFEVYINGSINARQRTYFGDLNAKFNYSSSDNEGLGLNSGDNIQVKIIHNRPTLGAFEARLLYAE